jgi:hypothetical protein
MFAHLFGIQGNSRLLHADYTFNKFDSSSQIMRNHHDGDVSAQFLQ